MDTWTNCAGTYTFISGAIYVGEWNNGEWHGKGTYTWANGEKYVGEWRDGTKIEEKEEKKEEKKEQ